MIFDSLKIKWAQEEGAFLGVLFSLSFAFLDEGRGLESINMVQCPVPNYLLVF